jgi:hypothetical protein
LGTTASSPTGTFETWLTAGRAHPKNDSVAVMDSTSSIFVYLIDTTNVGLGADSVRSFINDTVMTPSIRGERIDSARWSSHSDEFSMGGSWKYGYVTSGKRADAYIFEVFIYKGVLTKPHLDDLMYKLDTRNGRNTPYAR